jgi:hypothetical protein
VDVVVRDARGAAQEAREHLGVARGRRGAHLAPHDLRRELRGDLAALDAAHPVAHDEQRAARALVLPQLERGGLDELAAVEITDQEVILVVLADLADVARPRQDNLEDVRRCRSHRRAHRTSSILSS